jgi:hypothetical protein
MLALAALVVFVLGFLLEIIDDGFNDQWAFLFLGLALLAAEWFSPWAVPWGRRSGPR